MPSSLYTKRDMFIDERLQYYEAFVLLRDLINTGRDYTISELNYCDDDSDRLLFLRSKLIALDLDLFIHERRRQAYDSGTSSAQIPEMQQLEKLKNLKDRTEVLLSQPCFFTEFDRVRKQALTLFARIQPH